MNNKEEMIPKTQNSPFIQTKEYFRFLEFAESCAVYKYIGICHGNPGVGKTFTATEYTQPNILDLYSMHDPLTPYLKKNFPKCHGAMITVLINNTPKSINRSLHYHITNYGHAALRIKGEKDLCKLVVLSDYNCPLLVVDEADRLTYNSLEELRHHYDKYRFGMI